VSGIFSSSRKTEFRTLKEESMPSFDAVCDLYIRVDCISERKVPKRSEGSTVGKKEVERGRPRIL